MPAANHNGVLLLPQGDTWDTASTLEIDAISTNGVVDAARLTGAYGGSSFGLDIPAYPTSTLIVPSGVSGRKVICNDSDLYVPIYVCLSAGATGLVVGTSSTLALASNGSRTRATFCNDSTVIMWLCAGAAAVVMEGIILMPGQHRTFEDGFTGAYYAICAWSYDMLVPPYMCIQEET